MKKAIILAIAGALATPSAFAAEDTSGMLYTSAAEGFYASIRAAYDSGQNEGDTSAIGNSSSRFGVRGTNDLGGGLEGFYQYEAGVSIDNGGGLSTRLGHVGLRGTFGEVRLGSVWANSYNWVYGATDAANYGSGNFAYTLRASNVVQYTSPDMDGFQGSFLLQMVDRDAPASIEFSPPTLDANGAQMCAGLDFAEGDYINVSQNVPGLIRNCANITPAVEDDNDLDKWIVSARYEFGGVTAAGTYANQPDGLSTTTEVNGVDVAGVDDATAWAFRLGYGQDNWSVNGWYGSDNSGDTNADAKDVDNVSLSGVMSVEQATFYAVWEKQDNVGGESGVDNSIAMFGVQYNLGVNSLVWANYISRDNDDDAAQDDYVSIGLRHDF
jgi:predicted porin